MATGGAEGGRAARGAEGRGCWRRRIRGRAAGDLGPARRADPVVAVIDEAGRRADPAKSGRRKRERRGRVGRSG